MPGLDNEVSRSLCSFSFLCLFLSSRAVSVCLPLLPALSQSQELIDAKSKQEAYQRWTNLFNDRPSRESAVDGFIVRVFRLDVNDVNGIT